VSGSGSLHPNLQQERGDLLPAKGLLLGLSVAVIAGAASAVEPSPYAGWQARSIKALSPEAIEDYLEGRGMSMALPAELNGYPGPRHVLELAAELELTPEQLAQTERLFEDMRLKAIDLGEQIIAGEASLDELFASGAAREASLRVATDALARLNGRLRAHHLSYHLAIRDLLEPRQIQNYRRLRGYASSTETGEHGHAHTGHGGQ
jgi:Spy/CpxP family protein refolding chaperone